MYANTTVCNCRYKFRWKTCENKTKTKHTEKKNISRVAFFAHTARLHSILLGTKLYVQEASNEEQVLKENVNPEKEQR